MNKLAKDKVVWENDYLGLYGNGEIGISDGVGFIDVMKKGEIINLVKAILQIPELRDAIIGECEWTDDSMDKDRTAWQTQCGVNFVYENDLDREDNGQRYCHNCGKKIKEMK